MSRGRLNPKQSPGKGLQVMVFAHCLHIVFVIRKFTDIFRGFFSEGGGGGSGLRDYVGGSFHGRIQRKMSPKRSYFNKQAVKIVSQCYSYNEIIDPFSCVLKIKKWTGSRWLLFYVKLRIRMIFNPFIIIILAYPSFQAFLV